MAQYAPDHAQAKEYEILANKILHNDMMTIPTPITMEELEDLLINFGVIENEEEHIKKIIAQQKAV
ncbi:Nitrogenase iron protein [compost metagenome]